MGKHFQNYSHYEEVYLSWERLKTSMTKEAADFINKTDIQKLITYSARNSFRKNYMKFSNAAIDLDDVINVARCYSLIFYEKYRNNFVNEKQMNYSLCKFLGQKLYLYKIVTDRKFKEIQYKVDPIKFLNKTSLNDKNVNDSIDHILVSINTKPVTMEENSETSSQEALERLMSTDKKLKPAQMSKLKNISNMFVAKSEDELKELSPNQFFFYQYRKLAHEVYSKHKLERSRKKNNE